MRIVHVADSFAPDIGGIERQVETLVRRQIAQGHDVTVITAVAEQAALDSEIDVVRAAKGRWLTVAFPWRNRRVVAEVLHGRHIDVVHAHFTVISPIAVYVTRAASRRGIPVATTVHSLWWQVAVATRVSTLPFGWGRMRASWSGVSRTAANHVRRTLPRVQQVSVVPNLIDIDFWRDGVPAHRDLFGELRVVLVGRLKKRKHLDEIIAVVTEVRRQVPTGTAISVSIVGGGPRRDDLERQIDLAGMSDWIHLLGYQDSTAIRALHHRSHLFIASSRHEAFGIAAFEARAAGLPILGYHSSGLSDYITSGVDGVLVADRAEMVGALVEMARHPRQLEEMLHVAATEPPKITTDDAERAITDLYHRAQTSLDAAPAAAGRRNGTTPTRRLTVSLPWMLLGRRRWPDRE